MTLNGSPFSFTILDQHLGCFEYGLLSIREGRGALWRGIEKGEREQTREGWGEGWRNS